MSDRELGKIVDGYGMREADPAELMGGADDVPRTSDGHPTSYPLPKGPIGEML
jgi:hypothetical protein